MGVIVWKTSVYELATPEAHALAINVDTGSPTSLFLTGYEMKC